MKINNKYGYVVFYREKGHLIKIKYLVTNSYDLAIWEIENYKLLSKNRKTMPKQPIWYIKEIKTKLQSIIYWWGCPF